MLDYEFKQHLCALWEKHPGKMTGAAAGLVIGVLLLTIGFFKTLLLIACIAAGFWLGMKFDNGDRGFLQRIEELRLPNRFKLK